MAKIGIYKITNTVTNEIYIGASTNIDSRFRQHKKGNSSNEKLQNSICSCGLHCFTFEIIEECTKELLFDREFELIDDYSKNNKMFNSVYSIEEQIMFDKIIEELKDPKYNIRGVERYLNIPNTILSHAISGTRKIPKKYLELLLKELRL